MRPDVARLVTYMSNDLQTAQDRLECYQLKHSAVIRAIEGRASIADEFIAAISVTSADDIPEAGSVAPVNPIDIIRSSDRASLASALDSTARIATLDQSEDARLFWRWLRILISHVVTPVEYEVLDVVQRDVRGVIQGRSLEYLNLLLSEVSRAASSTTVNAQYWRELEHFLQNRIGTERIQILWTKIEEAAKNTKIWSQETKTTGSVSPFITAMRIGLNDQEFEFDQWRRAGSGRIPEHFAAARIGEEQNYREKNSVDHAEAWLGTNIDGYRFSLLYPDLADALEAPKYEVTKADNGLNDIRFIAPNYSDMIVRVLGSPWEHNKIHKVRPSSKFENGVLTLSFTLQRFSRK